MAVAASSDGWSHEEQHAQGCASARLSCRTRAGPESAFIRGESVTYDAPTATEPLSRSARRRAKRVDDILRVATRLLAERGYAATNLDEIAEVLDLSQASLYH